MEIWRDVTMILLGVIGALNMLLYKEIKAAIFDKADKSHIDEDRRRLTEHDRSIGEIYSKMYDAQINALTAINDSQAKVLQAISVFNHGGNNGSVK